MRTFLIIAAVILSFVFGLAFLDGQSFGLRSDKNDTSAIIHAEKAIESHLKSPSTAEFSGAKSKVKKVGDAFYVWGYVDAQNSFGAVIRSDYQVKVMFVGDGIRTSIIRTSIITFE